MKHNQLKQQGEKQTQFFTLAKAQLQPDPGADQSVFSGYASLFSLTDLGGDMVAPGAFQASLRRNPAPGIRMLWQHQATEPIGTWLKIYEDQRGLYVEGRLACGVSRANDALHLLRAGALDGLSIGFRPVRVRKDNNGRRHILEADLWEISLVTFPMLPQARVASVKSGLDITQSQSVVQHIRQAAAVLRH